MFKYVLLGLLVLQAVLSATKGGVDGFWNQTEENRSSANSLDILLEWTLTVTVVMGFYSMGLDVEKFSFVYESGVLVEKEMEGREGAEYVD